MLHKLNFTCLIVLLSLKVSSVVASLHHALIVYIPPLKTDYSPFPPPSFPQLEDIPLHAIMQAQQSSSTATMDQMDPELGSTIFPSDRREQGRRLGLLLRQSFSQSRESYWYGPWGEALSYLSRATSSGSKGTGISWKGRKKCDVFVTVHPQYELVYECRIRNGQFSSLSSYSH